MSVVIGYGNLVDSATVSTYGTWSGTYPATNVQNRFLGVFGRATSSAGAGIYLNLGSAETIGVIGLAGMVVPGDTLFSIDASNNNWASSVSVLVNQAFDQYGGGSSWFYTFEDLTYQYWRILFSAGTGQFDIGRVFIGPRFKPEYGLSFGASIGREVRTSRAETDGGARFHRTRTARRIITGSMDYLGDNDAHSFSSVQSSLDISNEAVLIWDDTDTSTKRAARNMLCNLDELDAIEFPYATVRKVGIKISEIIA